MATILVTGATGYIGGRLVPELLAAGHTVRCLVRNPAKLADAAWRDRVEVVAGDVTDRTPLDRALDGVDVAYYLVHSMGGPPAFDEVDRQAAHGVPRRRRPTPASAASSTSAGWAATTTRACRATCAAATRSAGCWPPVRCRSPSCGPR